MQDRVPTPGQEGRVLISPENGTTPFYAKISMADNPTQVGTPLNKGSLLRDSSAEPYGFKILTLDLSQANQGAIVEIPESGKPVKYFVATKNYQSDINGAGKTLLLRVDGHSEQVWNNDGSNELSGSLLDNWFNEDFLQTLDSSVRNAILDTTFIYTQSGDGRGTVSQLTRKVFTPSVSEYGREYSGSSPFNEEGDAFPDAEKFLNCFVENSMVSYYTRSIYIATTTYVNVKNAGALWTTELANVKQYARPCFCLPNNFFHQWYLVDGTVSEQPPNPTPSDIFDILTSSLLLVGENILTANGISPNVVTCETGYYRGTGTYGDENPNILTFSRPVKILLVFDDMAPSDGAWWDSFIYIEGMTRTFVTQSRTGGSSETVSFSRENAGKTIRWWSSDAGSQLNNGFYNFVALLA